MAKIHPSDGIGRIYVFWCVGTQRFKIGYSAHVKQRALAIQGQSPYPLRVVATKPGSMIEERDLHRKFRRFRSHSGWFDPPERAVRALLADFGISEADIYAEAHLV